MHYELQNTNHHVKSAMINHNGGYYIIFVDTHVTTNTIDLWGGKTLTSAKITFAKHYFKGAKWRQITD